MAPSGVSSISRLTCEPDFLLATLASILLLFAVFAVGGLVAGCGSGGG